jgi:predicted phosphodiesterase
MTRTIVLSDAHGYPELIRNALAHSGFVAGVDRLVYAGDFVDRGDRPQECLDLIDGGTVRIEEGQLQRPPV